MTPEQKRTEEKRAERKLLAKKLGRVIAKERDRIGLSQDAFAHEAGMHRSFICFIEGGQRSITLATLVEVARALKMPPSEILKKLKL